MKRKASTSHDEAIIRRLRKDPDFAAEYLKAALEDEDEPRVLLIALRHLAQAQGIAKVPGGKPVDSARNLRLCAGIRQLRQPIVEDILSCAPDVVTDLDHVFNCNL